MADARILPCLEQLIGVADSECECFAEGQSGSVLEPRSLIFLSDYVNLPMILKAGICSEEDLYQIGQDSIDEATLKFQNNLLQCWAANAKNKARKQWRGLVGTRECSRSFGLSGAIAGLMIHPDQGIVDGEMVIEAVGTIFNTTGTDSIVIKIYDQVTDTVLHTFSLDTRANRFEPNVLATPIVLPFRLSDMGMAKYWMLYDVPVGYKPLDGEINCGCSSSSHRLMEWVSIFGTSGDDLEDRLNWTRTDRHNGLLPQITLRCKVENGICPEDELDFATNSNAGMMAEAIAYLAASLTLSKVLRSSRINKETLQPDDFKKEERRNFNLEYRTRVDQLCQNMDPGSCYTCEPGARTAKVSF